MTLPGGVHPSKVPPPEVLDALTEADLFAVISWQQEQNLVRVGTQFWIDELSRRRLQSALDRIAEAAAQEAERASEIVRLTAAAAGENAKTVTLNQEMRDMTRLMMWLTLASVLLAAVALAISLVALLQDGAR